MLAQNLVSDTWSVANVFTNRFQRVPGWNLGPHVQYVRMHNKRAYSRFGFLVRCTELFFFYCGSFHFSTLILKQVYVHLGEQLNYL